MTIVCFPHEKYKKTSSTHANIMQTPFYFFVSQLIPCLGLKKKKIQKNNKNKDVAKWCYHCRFFFFVHIA